VTAETDPGRGRVLGYGMDDRRRTTDGFPGVAVAGITALISGLSVFVNSYGVHSIATPSVYTTAKNLVATLVLALGALAAWRTSRRVTARPPAGSSRWRPPPDLPPPPLDIGGPGGRPVGWG